MVAPAHMLEQVEVQGAAMVKARARAQTVVLQTSSTHLLQRCGGLYHCCCATAG